jgi:hypothetical protein
MPTILRQKKLLTQKMSSHKLINMLQGLKESSKINTELFINEAITKLS